MSEASHFQAVLTVGSSSPKCKPWGLEFLLRARPSASWTTYSFPMPKASNQGIPEAFPFFLLWSFLTPFSAFESLQNASFAYSHLLGLCLFPHNILNVSDGVSAEMYPYGSSTREVNMVVYVLLLFPRQKLHEDNAPASCKFWSIFRSVSHAFSSATMWSDTHPPPAASLL